MKTAAVSTIVLLSFSLGVRAQAVTAPESFIPDPQMVEEVEVETLKIGAQAPDFRLPGVDGEFYQLSDFKDAKALVILFTCNHCPTAQAYEARIKAIAEEYRGRSVALVAISPNSPLGLLLEELGYADMGDTYEDMQIRARDAEYNFPYLYDGDTHEASLKYGPVATPHVFVFDKERKLRYTGRIDGSEKPGTANAEDLRGAIEAVLKGGSIAEPTTKAFGCSTKWSWKVAWKEKVEKDWREAPVELQDIGVDGVRALLANDTDKLLLVNLWATWCGPCIIEYPEFLRIHRMYKDRDFEFVSISADAPEQKDKVLKFLEKKESAVRNFIFDSDDQYQLIEAVDPNWQGALPYTLLIEPGGKVIFSLQSTIDPLELKRKIVDHPLIGRYY
jgi:peroxiredoxin